jgi:hypothetical protein
VEEDGRWRATGETRWQTASQERVAAIGTPGESTMKTCGSSEVFGEQVDEEMTLRPPCSVGEACDSQPVETDRTWRLLGADGIRSGRGPTVRTALRGARSEWMKHATGFTCPSRGDQARGTSLGAFLGGMVSGTSDFTSPHPVSALWPVFARPAYAVAPAQPTAGIPCPTPSSHR